MGSGRWEKTATMATTLHRMGVRAPAQLNVAMCVTRKPRKTAELCVATAFFPSMKVVMTEIR